MSITMQILTFKEAVESAEAFVKAQASITEWCRHVCRNAKGRLLFQFYIDNKGKCNKFPFNKVHEKLWNQSKL